MLPLPKRRGLYVTVVPYKEPTLNIEATVRHFLARHFDVVVASYQCSIPGVKLKWHTLAESVSNFRFVAREEVTTAAMACSIPLWKYQIAKVLFPETYVSEHYEALFLWDDDISVLPGFDGDAVLKLFAHSPIAGLHPGLEGLTHYPNQGARNGHLSQGTVEIMAPIYSSRLWSCLEPMLISPFGLEVENPGGPCLCQCMQFYALPMMRARHFDTRTTPKDSTSAPMEMRQAAVEQFIYPFCDKVQREEVPDCSARWDQLRLQAIPYCIDLELVADDAPSPSWSYAKCELPHRARMPWAHAFTAPFLPDEVHQRK